MVCTAFSITAVTRVTWIFKLFELLHLCVSGRSIRWR
jgi:hypothetical protein